MKRHVDGVLLLDKPAGLSSNSALQQAKRLYRAHKAGHTGTLDPFATGLLPLCLGEATKFSRFLLDADKVYLAELKLGVRTRSGDPEGDVLAERPVRVGAEDLRALLPRFLGDIKQVPPMLSALKRDGRPLYDYARRGQEVAREARPVHVYALTLLHWAGDRCGLRVHCGKGFYVRALADDLGELLGCGAHLSALRRIAVGPFEIGGARTLDELGTMTDDAARDACLLPADVLAASLPALTLDVEATWQVRHGQSVWLPRLHVGEQHRLYTPDGGFLGVAQVDDDGKLAPRRLLAERGPASG